MTMIAKMLPQQMDACPPALRVVLTRWKSGKATNQDLIESSYQAQLDRVEGYRRLPLPTTSSTNPNLLAKVKRESFLVLQQNDSNRRTLEELLGWAESKKLSAVLLGKIRDVLVTHQDLSSPMDEAPEDIRAVFG